MFKDRRDAGQQLAQSLLYLAGEDVVVLGLPRGGVPVAHEVAAALDAPLDVIVVRKLGLPFQPELAMGAIGEGGVKVMNPDVLSRAYVTDEEVAAVERRELETLQRRAARFRAGREQLSLKGRTVVIVDDGIATGSTARAACQVARASGAERVVLATPVAPHDCQAGTWSEVDEFVCPHRPRMFAAIGQFYDDFGQVSDDEVVALLDRSPHPVPTDEPAPRSEEVAVAVDGVTLAGHLDVPPHARGVVLFAHGSGSSRHSPRNRYVAGLLQEAGFGTLLFDLLTAAEEGDRSLVFDIDLLAARLVGATRWLRRQPGMEELAVGYFGASTGAAAALIAASREPGVAAVVSRGGRPDLAIPWLPAVHAPTLLVVGSRDTTVLKLNRRAQEEMRCENRLAVVPDATHLFEEPGTLTQAAQLAADWFTGHLGPGVRHAAS